ncbi:UDP-glucose/GDP-mannose dehydrogenase family protein [Nakamurella sp. PAMC28650]|uniref:UDP-glucose dehydrogenase family protein n=1 Tax=Nakamurella sp. PAMC28650 TaxID=2762325 RepID=UPI00164D958D|nr:UDP-glucose/GDP-mannose dehydrogenase family protein [Nakamurella sp. PAMC28650]QNK81716.1 UDP-glucose/GDP-mannose dehydrogenase family protein [Nakamurella sp. PAMC28650]
MSVGRIAVIGTGYVGLTSGACLASLGHQVVCGDVDAAKVAAMSRGEVPILEPGLDEMMARGLQSGNLTFVHGAAAAAAGARYILLCLPTPDGGDGRADLRIVHDVVAQIGPLLDPGAILVTKSTVPVGTAQDITETVDRADVAVVSNPEFLQEGTAVRNFMNPDRIVVGSTDRAAALAVAELYRDLGAPSVVTSAESSELIKYAANAFLAMKLSFINSIGALAETVGADVAEIADGMGFDERIGSKFLRTGPGWGGSCFPKDTKALATIAADHHVSFPLLEATYVSNDQAQDRLADKVRAAAGGSLCGVRIALWGLTFKAGTDDLRDSPALAVALRLAAEGAVLQGFDPAISKDVTAARDRPEITVVPDPYTAAAGAAVLVILTEWPVFGELDLLEVGRVMPGRVIVDGRGMIDDETAAAAGFSLVPIGRPAHHIVPA